MSGKQFIEFNTVSFAYETQSESTIKDLTLQLPSGWTGFVGANGVGKSTLLQLAAGILKPISGRITGPPAAIYCRQRTDFQPNDFEQFMYDNERDAYIVKGKLGIEDDWLWRWDSLSHGERKRAQIGTALWQQPDLLAIDEPTNHLDSEARDTLLGALKAFRGIGLIVSHDKMLMDTLCSHCLFIDPPDFNLFPGNFSQGWKQVQRELETAEKQEILARKEYKRIEREVKKRRSEAAKADRKKSKRGIDKKDHDAKEKKNLAKLTGKDAVAGKLMNQLNGRARQAKDRLDSLSVKKSYETGIWQEGECSSRNTLFTLESGKIALGQEKTLIYPKLEMRPADRIALVGANGNGKSTLIKLIFDSLTLPKEKVTYLPQEIDQAKSAELLEEIKALSSDKLGFVMTFVNRLGTRPPSLLESALPSPGEIRKIMLAIGAAHVPHLMILDEPTNHLDLLSVECLKESLAGFPAGLLLVSHDTEFLEELTEIRWRITMNKSHAQECVLEVEG